MDNRVNLDIFAPVGEMGERLYQWLKDHQVFYLMCVFIVASIAGFIIAYAVAVKQNSNYCQRAGFAEHEVKWDFQRSCLRDSYSPAP